MQVEGGTIRTVNSACNCDIVWATPTSKTETRRFMPKIEETNRVSIFELLKAKLRYKSFGETQRLLRGRARNNTSDLETDRVQNYFHFSTAILDLWHKLHGARQSWRHRIYKRDEKIFLTFEIAFIQNTHLLTFPVERKHLSENHFEEKFRTTFQKL